MRIAICDDDKCLVENLKERIEIILDRWNIKSDIFCFNTGIDMLMDVDINGIYDVIFLDIKLGMENGIEIAKKLREENLIFSLVIISMYQSYYRDVFELDAKWFLDKPFDDEILEKVFRKIIRDMSYSKNMLEFSFKKSIYKLAVKDIIYIESNKRKLYIHCIDKKIYEYYAKLSEMEKLINEGDIGFTRINQSYLVNFLYIKRYSYDEIELYNGERMTISQNRRKWVKKYYLNKTEKFIN